MNQDHSPPSVSTSEEGSPEPVRRHDLDALRAAAMLLGIAYHVALSFSLGAGWLVQDVNQSKLLYLFQALTHGFRMQLFMFLSGFFTAMLWRRRGLKVLLWQRFRRVLLPCLASLVTVVPAIKWASSSALEDRITATQNTPQSVTPDASLWGLIKRRDFDAFAEHLNVPEVVTSLHPEFKITALSWASLTGSQEIVGALLKMGADVNWRSHDGHTALHGAAFFGREEVAELLLRSGADINALSHNGERPIQSALGSYSAAEYIARLLGIELQKEQVLEGRRKIVRNLEEMGAERGTPAQTLKGTFTKLVNTPVFGVVWFLWFLVWLILLFVAYAAAAERAGWRVLTHPLVVSQRNLMWLVPLTVIPAWFMRSGHGVFGPDTSMGILPMPHVLVYYGLFFGLGVLYFEGEDDRLGRAWRWTFPISLLLVFPIAFEFATGTFALREKLLPAAYHRAVSVVFQALYAWMMSFAWIGIFRSFLSQERKSIRYMSDASYWFYLAHLPLVIIAQNAVCRWPLPAVLKFLMICLLVTLILLVSYEKLIRYSFIGRFLNGRRTRPNA